MLFTADQMVSQMRYCIFALLVSIFLFPATAYSDPVAEANAILSEIQELDRTTRSTVDYRPARTWLRSVVRLSKKRVARGKRLLRKGEDARADWWFRAGRYKLQWYISLVDFFASRNRISTEDANTLKNAAQNIIDRLTQLIDGTPVNTAPVADAGLDQAVSVGDVVTLNGGGSSDIDGDNLTFSWTIINQPIGSAAILNDATAVTPIFTADVTGEFVVELVVNDGLEDSVPDTVVINASAANTKPVADPGADQSVTAGDLVTLDGSGSSDADGDSLTFQWSIVQQPVGSLAVLNDVAALMPTFTADLAGQYLVELTVNDGTENSDPVTVAVNAVTPNTLPVADAGSDVNATLGDTVALDGSGSSDVDGDNLSYRWSLTVRPPSSNAVLSDDTSVSPSFEADAIGQFVGQLIVNDGQDDSAPDTVIVNVEQGNTAPVADAGADQSVFVGDLVQLNGGNSSDADGDGLNYQWALTVRPAASSATLDDPTLVNPSFTADAPGQYVGQLIVNDGVANSAPDEVVISTQNSRPVADAGDDSTVLVGDTVTLDGSGSTDVDNDPLSYAWTVISRPAGSVAEISDPASAAPTLLADEIGLFVVQLIVSDGQLSSDPQTVTIRVEPAQLLAIVVDSPVQNFVTNQTPVDISGSLSHRAQLLLGSSPITVANDLRFTATVALQEGLNTFTFNAENALGDTAQEIRFITLDTQAPAPVVSGLVNAVPDGSDLLVTGQEGSVEPNALVEVTNQRTGETVVVQADSTGAFVVRIPGQSGDVLSIVVQDAGGNSSAEEQIQTGQILPPDPSTVAPSLDVTGITPTFQATEFLYTGNNPIQTGVAPGTIDPERVAVIRGNVLDSVGNALSGVEISIHDHDEYGQTLSRADGAFDMAVNGGGTLVLNYRKQGYLPMQRAIEPAWERYVHLEAVRMTQLDTQVTTIDLSNTSEAFQLASSSVSTDSAGSRQATILFPQGTQATMQLPDGSSQPLPALNVRATEYTVGDNGLQRMPAALPPMSGYTYAVELSADEAIAAGATRVDFSQPLPMYVDNFLNFPTGEAVPLGYYDYEITAWVPSSDGRVIEIIDEVAGEAVLDVVGNGTAATSQQLSDLGISNEELVQLAELYDVGKTLWRVQIDHFTPWDCNWPYGPPDDANPPPPNGPRKPGANNPDRNNRCRGCVIDAQSQTLGEDIDLIGTPYSLHYRSDRVPGYKATRTVQIPLSGDSLPASLAAIRLTVQVAGQEFVQTFPATTNQTFDYIWDGLDAYGREVQGQVEADIRIDYVYQAINYRSVYGFGAASQNAFRRAFARAGTAEVIGQRGNTSLSFSRRWQETLGTTDQRRISGLGGLSINVHHGYDETEKMIHLGDGTTIGANNLYAIIQTIAGDGDSGDPFFGLPEPPVQATLGSLGFPTGLAVAPNGDIYVAENSSGAVRRIDSQGIMTTALHWSDFGDIIFGEVLPFSPWDLDFGPDGNLYITDDTANKIWRFDPVSEQITRIAGSGTFENGDYFGDSGDGGPANQAVLSRPRGIDVDDDGTIMFVDGSNNKVKIVTPDGFINTMAGTGTFGFSGDGGPAIAASFRSPAGIAIGNDGEVYIADTRNSRIRRINQDGTIETVFGTGAEGFTGDGGPAADARLRRPQGLFVGPDGSLYISDGGNNRVRKVTPDGVINTIAGTENDNSDGRFSGDSGPATSAELSVPYGVILTPGGTLVVADAGNNRVRRVQLAVLENDERLFAAPDGLDVFKFDALGRHVETIDAFTKAKLFSFTYNADGYLSAIADVDGDITTIERDAANQPVAIVSEYGQRTELALDSNGFVATLTEPSGVSHQMTYDPEGLLTQYRDRNNNTYINQFNAIGLLESDVAPNGGGWTLSRVGAEKGHTVSMTSGDGRTQVFDVENRDDGSYRRTVRLSDGTTNQEIHESDGRWSMIEEDGMETQSRNLPDPRFGMNSPTKQSTVTTPGGLVFINSVSRVLALIDENDPLSLSDFTETETINGRAHTSVYDPATNAWTRTSAAGRLETIELDENSRPISRQVAGFAASAMTYDARGRMTSEIMTDGGDTRSQTRTYDANGYIATITDGLGQTHSFVNDIQGRITRQTYPDGRQVQFDYDANDNMTSLTTPSGTTHLFDYDGVDEETVATPPVVAGVADPVTTYSYNLDRQISRIVRPDGKVIDINYDATSGNRSSIDIPRGSYLYSYEPQTGNIASVTAPDSGVLDFTYDGFLNTSVTWSGDINGSVGHVYNEDYQLQSRNVNGTQSIKFNYDDDLLLTQAGDLSVAREAQQDGLISGTTLSNVVTARTHNAFGELTQYSATTTNGIVYQVNYIRDRLGRIAQNTESIGGVTTVYEYDYDPSGRLTEVRTDSVTTASYAYDDNSNRVGGTYDDQDRLLTWNGISYTYNENGELQSKTEGGATTTYSYDVLGNLVEATLPGDVTLTYVIDGQNRRIGKSVNGTPTQGFLYKDQINPIAELDGSGNVVSRFVYADKTNIPAFMFRGGQTYRIISDQLGSPRLVVDTSDDSIVQRIDYDVWGNVINDTNPGFQPFGFAGGLYDQHTGLVRLGARDYDPVPGRWTAKDPIRFDGDDVNLYGYVFSDPVNYVDLDGEHPVIVYAAVRIGGRLVINYARRLTQKQAINRLKRGKDIYSPKRSHAKRICKKAGGKGRTTPKENSGRGKPNPGDYKDHFHDRNRKNKSHAFFD